MDKKALRGTYARLRAIRDNVQSEQTYVLPMSVGKDFDNLIRQLENITGEELQDFRLPPDAYVHGEGQPYLRRDEAKNKAGQITQYLEYTFHINEEIVEIGSIYNSIRD